MLFQGNLTAWEDPRVPHSHLSSFGSCLACIRMLFPLTNPAHPCCAFTWGIFQEAFPDHPHDDDFLRVTVTSASRPSAQSKTPVLLLLPICPLSTPTLFLVPTPVSQRYCPHSSHHSRCTILKVWAFSIRYTEALILGLQLALSLCASVSSSAK